MFLKNLSWKQGKRQRYKNLSSVMNGPLFSRWKIGFKKLFITRIYTVINFKYFSLKLLFVSVYILVFFKHFWKLSLWKTYYLEGA